MDKSVGIDRDLFGIEKLEHRGMTKGGVLLPQTP